MSDEQKVLDALKDIGEPARPGQIAEVCGLDKAVVSKAIQNLKKEGKVNSPKRCCWAPV
jgi:DNA-binding MarR family transcriptional regulator